jgi:hypothetical protein
MGATCQVEKLAISAVLPIHLKWKFPTVAPEG